MLSDELPDHPARSHPNFQELEAIADGISRIWPEQTYMAWGLDSALVGGSTAQEALDNFSVQMITEKMLGKR